MSSSAVVRSSIAREPRALAATTALGRPVLPTTVSPPAVLLAALPFAALLAMSPSVALGQGLPPQAVSSGQEATSADGGPAAATPAADTPAAGEGTTQAGAPGSQAREARDLSLPRPDDKHWQVGGEMQYRTLVIRDADPANDQRMFYRLQAGYEPLENLILLARAGVVQRFVSVEDESGLRLEDASLSALLQQSVGLGSLGWDRQLTLAHRLRVYLPTSFNSQQEDLLFAAELSSRARVRLTGQLFAGVRGLVQYHAHAYAEQAGPAGAMQPRFVADALAFTEYSPLVSPKYGTLTVGGDIYVNQTFDYPSRDPSSIPAGALPPGTLADNTDTFLGAGRSDSFSSPNFGYDLYVLYQPPLEHLLFMASLEQVGSAQRYGETHVYLFHRDETELALRMIVQY